MKKLPTDLQLLYRNDYFDTAKVLIILNSFNRRKKGLDIDELVFYFTLIDSVIVRTGSVKVERQYLQDNYLKNELEIRNLVLRIADSGYIMLETEKNLSKTIVYIKNTDEGSKIVQNLENPIFNEMSKKLKVISSNFKYSVTMKKEMLKKNEER